MKYFKFYLLLLIILNSHLAYSQEVRGYNAKIGGFYAFNDSRNHVYSLNFEIEKLFKKAPFLSQGIRLDCISYKEDTSINKYIGYELKFYPLYWLYHKPLRGIYLGVDPFFLLKNADKYHNHYGPGIGTFAGFQLTIRKHITLSYEFGINYFQNVNKEALDRNNADRYFSGFQCIKVGIIF